MYLNFFVVFFSSCIPASHIAPSRSRERRRERKREREKERERERERGGRESERIERE